MNFRSISKSKDLDLLNCIGEEAKVDSAKTEESKYWFPSHARKRTENAGLDINANVTPDSTTFYQKKNKIRSSAISDKKCTKKSTDKNKKFTEYI